MTLSISARYPESGQLDIAISLSSMAVGSRCSWLLPGVGAVASQNITLPSLGPHILGALEARASVEQALNLTLAEDHSREYRQVAAIDTNGEMATFSGEHTLGIGGTLAGDNCVAAGNMLASHEVTAVMVTVFKTASDELASRPLAGLHTGVAAGGETGPIHSAAVKVVDGYPWSVVDLRINWAETDPLTTLGQLRLAWEPQMDAYITQALDPRDAPAYGVPGDE